MAADSKMEEENWMHVRVKMGHMEIAVMKKDAEVIVT